MDEADHSRLGRSVDGDSRRRCLSVYGTDRYNAAVVVRYHRFVDYRLRHEECSLQVDGYDFVEVCFIDIDAHHRGIHPDIVDKNIDPAEFRYDVVHHIVHRLNIGDVDIIYGRSASHACYRLVRLRLFVCSDTVHYDISSVFGEFGGYFFSDPLGASGDQYHFSFKLHFLNILSDNSGIPAYHFPIRLKSVTITSSSVFPSAFVNSPMPTRLSDRSKAYGFSMFM